MYQYQVFVVGPIICRFQAQQEIVSHQHAKNGYVYIINVLRFFNKQKNVQCKLQMTYKTVTGHLKFYP